MQAWVWVPKQGAPTSMSPPPPPHEWPTASGSSRPTNARTSASRSPHESPEDGDRILVVSFFFRSFHPKQL